MLPELFVICDGEKNRLQQFQINITTYFTGSSAGSKINSKTTARRCLRQVLTFEQLSDPNPSFEQLSNPNPSFEQLSNPNFEQLSNPSCQLSNHKIYFLTFCFVIKIQFLTFIS